MIDAMGLTKYCLLILFLVLSSVAMAQPGGGGNPGGEGEPVPISGIEILLGLGGLLGAKKLFDARKKN